MDKDIRDIATNLKNDPHPGGVSHEAKMARVTAQLLLTIDEFKTNLETYGTAANKESKAMRNLTIALGVVAILQLIIAYGQFRLGWVQTEVSQGQTYLQNAIWNYDKMRNDRIEARDVEWRREDLQYQGRLP